MAIKLEVKIFIKYSVSTQKQAFELLEQGWTKNISLKRPVLPSAIQDANLKPLKKAKIFIVIMGLSGSGKSTLVRLLNRLIEPTRGQVLIDGEDIAVISDQALREVRRRKNQHGVSVLCSDAAYVGDR